MRGLVIGLFVAAIAIGWRAATPDAADPAPAAEPSSPPAPRQSGGSVIIPRGEQGHFFVSGDVAGKSLRFVVDTGATVVAVGREDAKRLGFDLPDSAFDRRLTTASGEISGAAITLPRLRVGSIQLLGVRAMVLDVPNAYPLLGQSFLSRLDRVTIEGRRMTLSKG